MDSFKLSLKDCDAKNFKDLSQVGIFLKSQKNLEDLTIFLGYGYNMKNCGFQNIKLPLKKVKLRFRKNFDGEIIPFIFFCKETLEEVSLYHLDIGTAIILMKDSPNLKKLNLELTTINLPTGLSNMKLNFSIESLHLTIAKSYSSSDDSMNFYYDEEKFAVEFIEKLYNLKTLSASVCNDEVYTREFWEIVSKLKVENLKLSSLESTENFAFVEFSNVKILHLTKLWTTDNFIWRQITKSFPNLEKLVISFYPTGFYESRSSKFDIFDIFKESFKNLKELKINEHGANFIKIKSIVEMLRFCRHLRTIVIPIGKIPLEKEKFIEESQIQNIVNFIESGFNCRIINV